MMRPEIQFLLIFLSCIFLFGASFGSMTVLWKSALSPAGFTWMAREGIETLRRLRKTTAAAAFAIQYREQ
jgi:hypothetical protein